MALMPEVDRRSVGAGALVGIAFIFPAVIAFQIVDAVSGIDCDSNLNLVFFVPVLVAWVAGGWVAARRQPDAPFTHGALAALSSFAVFAGTRVLTHALISHRDSCSDDIVKILTFNGFVAATSGIIGGLLAGRTRPS